MARRPISDERWRTLEPLLPVFTSSPKGRRRRSVDDRAALSGILFVLQTGIAWEDLPKELGWGSGMTCVTTLAPLADCLGVGQTAPQTVKFKSLRAR